MRLVTGLLVQVAERLAQVAPAGATLARIGGDEFAFALPGVRHPNEALAVAEAFRESLVEAFRRERQDGIPGREHRRRDCPD